VQSSAEGPESIALFQKKPTIDEKIRRKPSRGCGVAAGSPCARSPGGAMPGLPALQPAADVGKVFWNRGFCSVVLTLIKTAALHRPNIASTTALERI
jgi:hypothetical protein